MSSNHRIKSEYYIHDVIHSIRNSEERIRDALRRKTCIDSNLVTFHDLHELQFDIHIFWVHRLAHFLGQLYEQKDRSWARKLAVKAFQGEKEFTEWISCFQIAECFTYHAQWDEIPSDSMLTPDNIGRLIWPSSDTKEFCKTRINLSPFKARDAFYQWQLLHPCVISKFDFDLQCSVIQLRDVETAIKALHEAGTCEAELFKIKGVLLAAQADEIGCVFGDWKRKQVLLRIKVFKELINHLLPSDKQEPNKSIHETP